MCLTFPSGRVYISVSGLSDPSVIAADAVTFAIFDVDGAQMLN